MNHPELSNKRVRDFFKPVNGAEHLNICSKSITPRFQGAEHRNNNWKIQQFRCAAPPERRFYDGLQILSGSAAFKITT